MPRSALRPLAVAALVVLEWLRRGGVPKQKTHPLTGSVTLDGKPVAGALVVFHPKDKSAFKWDERPQGRTDAAGKFVAFTYSAGDGVPAGEYQVAIALLGAADDDGNDQARRAKQPPLPARYAKPDTSGLTATVQPEPNDLPAFALTGK